MLLFSRPFVTMKPWPITQGSYKPIATVRMFASVPWFADVISARHSFFERYWGSVAERSGVAGKYG